MQPNVVPTAVGDTAVVYSSRRIRIRTVAEDDLPLLWAAMQAPDFERFWPPPQPDSYAALCDRFRWLRRLEQTLEIDAIATLAATGEPFAWLKLSGIDTHHRKAEFSVYVHHLRGTRAAQEAVVAAIELAFGMVDKLFAHALADNRPAIRLLHHLGFREEGRLRGEIAGRDGLRQDVLRFGQLRPDWEAQSARRLLSPAQLTIAPGDDR
ncbi:MAG: GNAT family N-acetyltransferase [Burkholderiales bacterium]|nr:GNAT family N-acetyltransferase [Burkholderiales bacterium]